MCWTCILCCNSVSIIYNLSFHVPAVFEAEPRRRELLNILSSSISWDGTQTTQALQKESVYICSRFLLLIFFYFHISFFYLVFHPTIFYFNQNVFFCFFCSSFLYFFLFIVLHSFFFPFLLSCQRLINSNFFHSVSSGSPPL